MADASRLLTVEDLLAMPPDPRIDYRDELIRGVLVRRMPMWLSEARAATAILMTMARFVRDEDLGECLHCGFILSRNPDTLLAPDVALIPKRRLPVVCPEGEADCYPAFAPDVAIDVVTHDDPATYVFAKVDEYLAAGVRLLGLVDAQRQSVTVFGSDRRGRILRAGDELDGGDVVPGFRLPIAALFEGPR